VIRAFITGVVVIAFWPAVGAAQTDANASKRLSLADAVRLAVAQNRQIEQSRLVAADADERLAIAKTYRFPSLETSGSGSLLLTPVSFAFPRGAFGDIPGVGPLPAADTEVTSPRRPTLFLSSQVIQPLTPLLRLTLGVRAAAAARDRERERTREQELAVATAVKRLYVEMQRTAGALRSSEEALALLREVRRSADVRAVQRIALRGDAIAAEAELAGEELTRTTRANALASQQEQMNVLLGRDVRHPFEIDPLPPPAPADVDVDAAIARALDARPDVRQARLTVDEADLDRRAKAAERIPDVSLALAYSTNTNIDVLPRNLATVGVQVRWEPFDWGRRRRELSGKAHAVARARLALRDAEDRTVVEIRRAARALGEARAAVGVAAVAQRAAREQLRTTTVRYQTEAAVLADVLRSRAALAERDDRYLQALTACWTARTDLDLAIGEDLVP
jgi:outer membrane protein TolC